MNNELTGREMLELAAKAAGYDVIWNENWRCYQHGIPVIDAGLERHPWIPLENDGDVMRLAVKLELSISHRTVDVVVSRGDISASVYVPTYSGREEATRLAIVRVAAKIGRSMK